MKYYLLNNQKLHECHTAEERYALTKTLLSYSDEAPKILKRLAIVGRGHEVKSPKTLLDTYWWFTASMEDRRVEQMITDLHAKVDLLVAETDASRRAVVHVKPAELAAPSERELAGVSNLPASAPDLAPGIQLGGGMTLESFPTDGGTVWKVLSAGNVLAQTKPGSRFLVIADNAVDGAWFNAASHILDSIP